MKETDEIVARYLRENSQDAGSALYAKFLCYSMKIAHKRLGESFSRIVDAEDIVQSAFRSTFRWVKKNENEVISGEVFRFMLGRITECKVAGHYRKNTRVMRDFRRNRAGSPETLADENSEAPWQVLEAADVIETFIQSLDADRQDLARHLMQLGRSPAELSLILGLSKRAIERHRAKLTQSLIYFLKKEGLYEEQAIADRVEVRDTEPEVRIDEPDIHRENKQ